MILQPRKNLSIAWIACLVASYVAAFIAVVPKFLGLVVSLGRSIPGTGVLEDYVTACIWALVLGASLWLWPVSKADRSALLVAWCAKVFVALVFMLFYESFYSLDAIFYYTSSAPRLSHQGGLSLGDGANAVTYLASLQNRILPYSYHALKITWAMLGLGAVYLFYRSAVFFLGREDRRIFYLLVLCPSILFWSTIFGKDPIGLLGICLYIYGVVGFFRFRRSRFALCCVAGLIVSMCIRLWMAPILLFPTAVLAYANTSSWAMRALFSGVTLLAGALLLRMVLKSYALDSVEDTVRWASTQSSDWNSTSTVGSGPLQFSGVGSMLRFYPVGVFTALFRPLPGEIRNAFGLLAGAENLVLLVLFYRSFRRTRLAEMKEPLVLFALALILTWASFYAFVSYLNLGAAVRFRLQIMPLLLSVLLYFGRDRRRDLFSGESQAIEVSPPIRGHEQ